MLNNALQIGHTIVRIQFYKPYTGTYIIVRISFIAIII